MPGRLRPCFVLASLSTSCLVACAPGPFAPQGYTNESFAYIVGYADPGGKALLPAPWRLDNFNRSSDSFDEKRDGAYMATRELDDDENGEISPSESRPEAVFDVKLQNDRDNGVIWTKAHPMRYSDRDRELGVLVDNYIDSLSGTGLYEQGSIFNQKHNRQLSFVTFVKSKREIQVDRHAAVEAVVEIAEAEKVKLDPSYRRTRVKVVFTRFEYVLASAKSPIPSKWPSVGSGFGERTHRRGILVAGYANTGEAFERSEAAFDALVQRIRFPKSVPAPSTPSAPIPQTSGSAASPRPAPSSSAAP